MEYVIYTYGGGDILWRIFNSLALFFYSDSTYLTGIVKLSLTIGGLWAALRAIYGGRMGILARDYFIPAYLILNIFLLPKTSVHIIDEVSSDFKYAKVDHVPLGITAITSTASKLSKFITERVENSLKTAEATQFGKTGPMFAAKLISQARDLRLIDPVQRQNMKDFVRQCFTLPMVWTNILAGKKAALESTNILELIAENPHHWLGSYWKKPGGESEFLYCKDGSVKAREILKEEIPRGLVGLATDLFGGGQIDDIKASQKLKKYFEDGWHALSKEAISAHDAAGQEMIMNAYREGLDDKRQEFGLDRLYPHLVSGTASRAKSQQNTGFLISAEMFALLGPTLQSTLFGILCVLFVIVIPMALLPGGLSALGMWVKLIIWVSSWPVFYAIINCVAMMIAAGKAGAYVKTGAGLSLATQNGLADATYDAYCYAQGFMCLVPALAWAVISKSGYALANLAGSVTRGLEGLSSKMGSDLVDGNLSFDNQSFHNRSIAGYQVAQQQLAPNFSFGSKYDDGRMNVTYDTQGHPIIQEAQTNLKTNVAGTDSLATSLSENAQHSLQASHNYSKMASDQLSQGLDQMASFAQQYSKGQGMTEGFGRTDNIHQQQHFQNTIDIAHKFGQQHQLSDDKAFSVLAKAGISTGAIGKLLGLDAGISGSYSLDAHDRKAIDAAKHSGLQDQFNDNLNKAMQHSFENKGQIIDQDQRQAQERIDGSFRKAQSYQEQANASLQESDTFSRAASIAQSSGGSITSNWNDQALAYVAQKKGMSLQQAAHWSSANQDAYKAEASEFMSRKLQPLLDSLKEGHALSNDQIREKFNSVYGGKVSNTVSGSDMLIIRDKALEEGVGTAQRIAMNQRVGDLRQGTTQAFDVQNSKLSEHQKSIQSSYQNQESAYNKRKEDGVILPIVKRVGNKIVQVDKDLGGYGAFVVDKTSQLINKDAPVGKDLDIITGQKVER